ncbi:MAG: 6-hydroxymethylpterin diphosphokinase MptE-like protein [Thermoplasmata archaeon]
MARLINQWLLSRRQAVEYAEWAPEYTRIRAAFGFPFDREVRSAQTLRRLLPPSARVDPLGRIGQRLHGRDAIVVGLAPGAGPPPIWRLPPRPKTPVLLAADGATASCMGAGLVPAIIVTDLDGPVPSEISANSRGALAVVHAHGDNIEALERWVPQFPGELAGSWAGPPTPDLIDVGGFTDGDRAVYLAEHVGAERILLWGFDFDRIEEVAPREREHKIKKLAFARGALHALAARSSVPIVLWSRDGSLDRFGAHR